MSSVVSLWDDDIRARGGGGRGGEPVLFPWLPAVSPCGVF